MPAFKRFVDGTTRPRSSTCSPRRRRRPTRSAVAGSSCPRSHCSPTRWARSDTSTSVRAAASTCCSTSTSTTTPTSRWTARPDSARRRRPVGGGARRVPLVAPCPCPAGCRRSVTRLGVDRDPIDVTDPIGRAWLEACVWPDQADRFHRLRAAIGLATTSPPPASAEGDAVGSLAARGRRRRRRRPSGGDELLGAQLSVAAGTAATTSPNSTASARSVTCPGCSPSRRSWCRSCRSSTASLRTDVTTLTHRPLAGRDAPTSRPSPPAIPTATGSTGW